VIVAVEMAKQGEPNYTQQLEDKQEQILKKNYENAKQFEAFGKMWNTDDQLQRGELYTLVDGNVFLRTKCVAWANMTGVNSFAPQKNRVQKVSKSSERLNLDFTNAIAPFHLHRSPLLSRFAIRAARGTFERRGHREGRLRPGRRERRKGRLQVR